MIVLTEEDPVPRRARGAVVTIGNFDGVHRGHRKILRAARSLAAARRTRSIVLTFDPHPAFVTSAGPPPLLLATAAQRRELLGEEGLDFLYEQRFDDRRARLSPEEWYAETLGERLDAVGIVVGENFCFGRERSGNVKTLEELSRARRVLVEPVPMETLSDGTPVSSSRIRAALLGGDVETAARMLGRPYFIDGAVVPGSGRGADLGFATANLDPGNPLLPKDGVYVTQAEWGGRRRPSVTNVGERPTFGERGRVVETHLLGYEGPLDDTARARMRLHFHRRLRDEVRFPDAAALREQIARDVADAKGFFDERS